MEALHKSIGQALDRAIQAVGVLPALLTLAAVGAIMSFAQGGAVWLAATLFGAFGAAEVLHRQQKAALVARREAVPERDLFFQAFDAHPKWRPKVLKEFECGGRLFRAMGFEELEIPMSIAGPLCPRCGGHLAERRQVRFPFRHWIEHRCICGFCEQSAHTLGELREEARDLAGCPK